MFVYYFKRKIIEYSVQVMLYFNLKVSYIVINLMFVYFIGQPISDSLDVPHQV